MHEVLIYRGLGGLSLPRKSLVRLSGRPDMPIAVYRGRKTTTQQQQKLKRFTTLFSRFIQDATRRNLCPGLTRRLLSPRLPRPQTRVSKSCSQDSCPLISWAWLASFRTPNKSSNWACTARKKQTVYQAGTWRRKDDLLMSMRLWRLVPARMKSRFHNCH